MNRYNEKITFTSTSCQALTLGSRWRGAPLDPRSSTTSNTDPLLQLLIVDLVTAYTLLTGPKLHAEPRSGP